MVQGCSSCLHHTSYGCVLLNGLHPLRVGHCWDGDAAGLSPAALLRVVLLLQPPALLVAFQLPNSWKEEDLG